jgi:hypothetical protein
MGISLFFKVHESPESVPFYNAIMPMDTFFVKNQVWVSVKYPRKDIRPSYPKFHVTLASLRVKLEPGLIHALT